MLRYPLRALYKFSTLVIAEHNNKSLVKNMSKLLKAASLLKEDVKSW